MKSLKVKGVPMKAEWILDAAVLCSTGRVRTNNEDNFYFNGSYLKQENVGLAKAVHKKISGKNDSVFCIFDGMGGGDYGEAASFSGAKALKKEWTQIDQILHPERFLEELCQTLNLAVCAEQEVLGSERMGSTMALLLFHDGMAYTANLGDSKIFLLRGDRMEQLSRDHDDSKFLRQMNVAHRKPRLTQYLGMDPEKVRIEPYISSVEVRAGDRFLICSDGLTDMVDTESITRLLAESGDAGQAVQVLSDRAMEQGGADNTTVIVCMAEGLAFAGNRKWLFPWKHS